MTATWNNHGKGVQTRPKQRYLPSPISSPPPLSTSLRPFPSPTPRLSAVPSFPSTKRRTACGARVGRKLGGLPAIYQQLYDSPPATRDSPPDPAHQKARHRRQQIQLNIERKNKTKPEQKPTQPNKQSPANWPMENPEFPHPSIAPCRMSRRQIRGASK